MFVSWFEIYDDYTTVILLDTSKCEKNMKYDSFLKK